MACQEDGSKRFARSIGAGQPALDGIHKGVACGGRGAGGEQQGVIATRAHERGSAGGISTEPVGFEPFEALACCGGEGWLGGHRHALSVRR